MSNKLILLVNLGSPYQLSVSAIRSFLRQFLSDRRVVGLPRLLWYPILYAIILPLRAKKLLHKYQQIWHSSGKSPLIHYTQLQANNLQTKYQDSAITVDYAFCYGRETVCQQLNKYFNNKTQFDELVVVPLYPQYSSSTTLAVFDQISAFFKNKYFLPKLQFINSFHDSPQYIRALASTIRTHWHDFGRGDKLVVSFHSIPVKLVDMGDTYINECKRTYDLLCEELDLIAEIDAKLCFQSKFGRSAWVTPSTEETVTVLAKAGVKTIDVICPGFVSDCLETLEEVAISYHELFISHGGVGLRYIPALNGIEELTEILYELTN